MSSAFDQQFSREPQLIKGYDNLYGMEVDSKTDPSVIESPGFIEGDNEINSAFILELVSNVSDIDEIMAFASVMKSIEQAGINLGIFGTAPVGNTLKPLKFTGTVENF